MSGANGSGLVPSLPPPQPKSPPELYGRRRELAKVQRLEREIDFLEEELKSIEGLQLASRSCKEVTDFVTENADPFVPTAKKISRSCRFWKWLWYQTLPHYHYNDGGVSCFKISWICCCSCPSRLKMPSCCNCDTCNPCGSIPCDGCCCCRLPKWHCCCFSCCNSTCFKISKCSMNCCCSIPKCPGPTCSSSSSCTGCSTCYPKSVELKNNCSCCHKSSSCCCYPCYICY